MAEKCVAAISIKEDLCSGCTICHSVCPYEAIKRDPETGKVEIDLQKCQVCGICYSACPVMAVDVTYYDYENLIKRVTSLREKCKSDTLVIMCRGNSPSTGEMEEILKQNGLKIQNYIPLRVPCAGRIPAELVFKALQTGIKRVVSIQCEDEFCRFKQGTKINTRRMMLSGRLLEQLGLDKNAFKVIKYSRKAVYDTSKCVGCDKCVFVCPYKAIEAQQLATPRILEDKCKGCGACALVCPYNAIEVKGFEFDSVLKGYTEAARQLKKQGLAPLILAFVCQWSEFPALDNPESTMSKNVLTLEVPCFKALDPVHVFNALHNGFDGVMAAVCAPEDCKLQEGKETAERNITVLKNSLKKRGLLDRFDLFTVHPRKVGEFEQRLADFCKKIASLPPQEAVIEEVKAHV